MWSHWSEWVVTFRSHAGQCDEEYAVTARNRREAAREATLAMERDAERPGEWAITDVRERAVSRAR